MDRGAKKLLTPVSAEKRRQRFTKTGSGQTFELLKREGCVLLADRCGRPRRRPASRLVWTQRRASRTVQTNVCLFSDAVRASFYSKSILCQDRLGTSIGKAV
jgi:hypothetical protein